MKCLPGSAGVPPAPSLARLGFPGLGSTRERRHGPPSAWPMGVPAHRVAAWWRIALAQRLPDRSAGGTPALPGAQPHLPQLETKVQKRRPRLAITSPDPESHWETPVCIEPAAPRRQWDHSRKNGRWLMSRTTNGTRINTKDTKTKGARMRILCVPWCDDVP